MSEIQEVLSIEIEKLLKNEYGLVSFESEKSKILFIREILQHLNNIDPILSQSKRIIISNFVGVVRNLFNSFVNYTGSNKEVLVRRLNELIDTIPTEIEAIIAMNLAIQNEKLKDDFITKQMEKAKIEIEEINKQKKKINDTLKKQEQESEDILKKMKENMATTGIADYANIFQKESNTHKINSRIWLGSIVLLVGIVIAIALGLLIGDIVPKDEKTTTLLQFTFAKLIIFSSLFFLLTLAFKSYKASKHNEILNKHRQNAITTFEKFVKSANDDRTKNAVLLQTVDAIFSQQNTGYNDNDSDAVSPQTKILEIINSSTKND